MERNREAYGSTGGAVHDSMFVLKAVSITTYNLKDCKGLHPGNYIALGLVTHKCRHA